MSEKRSKCFFFLLNLPVYEQILDVLHPIHVGIVLWRESLVVLDPRLGPTLQQRAHDLRQPEGDGQEEGRPPVAGPLLVHIGTLLDQVADQGDLPLRVVGRAGGHEVEGVLAQVVLGRAHVHALDVDQVAEGTVVQLGAGGEELDAVFIPFHAIDVELEAAHATPTPGRSLASKGIKRDREREVVQS